MIDIATGLAEREVLVDLALVRAEGEYLDQVPDGVRLVDLDSHRTAASILKLVGYLRRERPDAILSTLAHANVVTLITKLLFARRLRVVVRVESTFTEMYHNVTFKQRQTLRVLKWLLPSADGIVAVSQGVADDLRSIVPTASDRITAIPNPVVTPDLDGKAGEPVDHPWFNDDCTPVILSAGRLSSEKDHATLLRAFAEVLRSRPARLVILGEGPERENLLDMAERLEVSQHVDLPGFKINPFAYMSRSSALVLSSRYEGFPNVLVQAMACGTPVVSTDCRSGPREILQDGKWGPLVPVGNWRHMARAILETLDDPVPSDRLISRASVYSAQASVDRYLELLTGIGN